MAGGSAGGTRVDVDLLKAFKKAFGSEGREGPAGERTKSWDGLVGRGRGSTGADGPGEREKEKRGKGKALDLGEAASSLEQTLSQYEGVLRIMERAGVNRATLKRARQRLSEGRALLENAKNKTDHRARVAAMVEEFDEELNEELWEARDDALDYKIPVERNGKNVEVPWSSITGFEAYDEQSQELMLQTVAGKVDRGETALGQLIQGEDGPEPTVANATDLLWALQSKANDDGGEFNDELRLPDSKALRQYLERCQGALFPKYPLGSGGGGSLDLWGLDTQDDHERMLPAGLGRLEFKSEKGTDGKAELVIRLIRDASDLTPAHYATTRPSGPVTVLRNAVESCSRMLERTELSSAEEGKLARLCSGLVASAPAAARAPLQLSLSGNPKLPAFLLTLGTVTDPAKSQAMTPDKAWMRQVLACLGEVRRAILTDQSTPG